MFVKLMRKNHCGETMSCLVNTDMIIGVTEKHVEDIELYDAEGNVVETRKGEKTYEIVSKGGMKTIVDEDNYNTLEKALIK